MSQPLYFIPGAQRSELTEGQRLRLDVLRRFDLADVFADVGPSEFFISDVREGPTGKSGVLLCYQSPVTDLPQSTRYAPAEQEWREGKAWLGINTQSPPTPQDLERRRKTPGYVVALANDKQWQVPIIRRPDASSELPREMYWDASGSLVEPVQAAYRDIWERTEHVCQWFFADDAPAFDKGSALKLAIAGLGVNYRYGIAEHNAIRAIDAESLHTVLMCMVDLPRAHALELAQKKTE